MHVPVEKTKQLGIEITRFFSFHRIDSFVVSELGLNAIENKISDQYVFGLNRYTPIFPGP